MLTDFLLTHDILLYGCLFTLLRAWQVNLSKLQRKLTNGSNCIHTGCVKQQTTRTVEHTIKETSEKSGETGSPGETLEELVIDPALVETLFKVLAKAR